MTPNWWEQGRPGCCEGSWWLLGPALCGKEGKAVGGRCLCFYGRFIIYASYALAFWYGVKLIMDDRDACDEDPSDCNPRYTPSSLLIVRTIDY